MSAPPRTCRREGCGQPAQRLPGSGAQPQYCESHRPKRRERDVAGANARKASRLRETRELAIVQGIYRGEMELLAIAATIAIAGDDPIAACSMAGVQFEPHEAAELVALAKARHAELISGEPQALDRLLKAGITRLAATAAMAPAEIAPGQRAGSAYALGRLRETLGLSSIPRFSSIVLEITGPAGERLTIGPTNAPKETHGAPGTEPS